MHVDKDDVVELLRARGDHDKAATVQCALPRHVDTDADAGILHQFDVNVAELAEGPQADSESDWESDRESDRESDQPSDRADS